MGLPRGALEELHAKYTRMLAMRLSHESGAEVAHEVPAQMAELALRFPGALREIDVLELVEIRRRIKGIEDVLEGRCEVQPWMEAVSRFHALARGALGVKRWLGKRKRVDAGVERQLRVDLASLPFPEEARAWAHDLARIASPPRGRVIDAVFARLAGELGMSERAARELVFGARRRSRAAGGERE